MNTFRIPNHKLLAVQSDNAPDFLIFMPAIRQAIWQEVIRVHKSFEMSTCVSALLSLKFQEWNVYPRTNRVIYLEDGFWLRHQVTITDQKLNPGQCLWTKRGLMYCSWFDIHNYFFFVRLMLCQNSYNGHGHENMRLTLQNALALLISFLGSQSPGA